VLFAAMFCENCGAWLRSDYKYCPKCGKTSGENTKLASTSSTISFHEFKAKKSTERGKFLDNKSKKRKTADENPVIITVGIASSKKGILKLIRGKSLPLKVSKSASAETIREEALKKRAAYDRSFRSDQTYKLCYPDGSEVVNLPGSDEPFTLEKYKEDLGKAFSRITLLLCPLQEMDIHDEQEHVNLKTRDHGEESEFMSL